MIDYISKINDLPIGGTQFDGDWTKVNSWLSTAFTMTANSTKTFDISTLIPDDGFDYEVQFSIYTNSSGTSGFPALYIKQGTTAHYDQLIAYVGSSSAGTDFSCENFILPILSSGVKKITIYASSAVGNTRIGICAIRRMNNNSTLTNPVENVIIPNNTTLPIKGDFVDGQWVDVYRGLYSNVSIASGSSHSFDLSPIIPDTNYSYEIALALWAGTGSVKNNAAELVATDSLSNIKYISRAVTRQATAKTYGGNLTAVVSGSNPIISIKNNGNSTTTINGLRVCGYKRLAKLPTSDFISKLNDYPIGGDTFNGSWTITNTAVINGVSYTGGNTYNVSISNYLPDNTNYYEICCTGSGISGTALGNTLNLNITGDENIKGRGMMMGLISNRGTAGTGTPNTQFFKICAKQDSSGKLNIVVHAYASGTSTNVRLNFWGYRRMGTAGELQ